MHAYRFVSGSLVAGVLLGTLLGAGPMLSAAEAGPKKIRKHRQEVRHHERQKVKRHRKQIKRHRRATTSHYRDHQVRATTYGHRYWYDRAPRFYVADRPFYFHTGLNVYFGGLHLNLQLGNAPPPGYVYYDPYCHQEFYEIAAYNRHVHHHHHAPALRVIPVAYCDY